ncbi:MAG: aminoglycoside phosphotransferase family protein [Geminicoccaceae bacterium]
MKRLPQLVADLTLIWSLEDLGEPLPNANVSCVIPARHKGADVILKVQWPHEECRYEADALRVWDGDGAARLVAHDPVRHALLLERCLPGRALAEAGHPDPMAVMIELLPRLWKPAGPPFKPLADQARGWASKLVDRWLEAGCPCERALVDAALMWLDELTPSQGEQVLVHQDLHGDNVIEAACGTWLAIDPKPLVGERAFALAPVIRSFEFGHSRDQVIGRLDRLASDLSVDRTRAEGWAIAQTIAWSFGSDYAQQHYETARWLLNA